MQNIIGGIQSRRNGRRIFLVFTMAGHFLAARARLISFFGEIDCSHKNVVLKIKQKCKIF